VVRLQKHIKNKKESGKAGTSKASLPGGFRRVFYAQKLFQSCLEKFAEK